MSGIKRIFSNTIVRILLIVITMVVLIGVGGYSFFWFQTTPALAYPKIEHFHVRLQLIIDGQQQNFAEGKFQVAYEKGQCSNGLTVEPLHFHDNTDQILHIHWQGITGGQVLKFYGLNLIGGDENRLGYRMDKVPFEAIPIHGKAITEPKQDDTYWLYVGDEKGYQKREWNDFLKKSLDDFLGKKSALREAADKKGLFGFTSVSAYADHGHTLAETAQTTSRSSTQSSSQLSKEDLEAINELFGNIVIFAQKTEPQASTIQDRFDHLQPLPLSQCGG